MFPGDKGVDRTYGEVGDAVLAQMRELDTAQCALRIGRGVNGRGAIIFLDSAAIPDWIPVVNPSKPADVSKWLNGERAVRRAVAAVLGGGAVRATDGGRSCVRTADIADAVEDGGVEMSDRHLRRVLDRHADHGLLESITDPADGRRTAWVDTGLTDLSDDDTAVVELPTLATDGGKPRTDPTANKGGGEEVPDISRITLYTQNVRKACDTPPPLDCGRGGARKRERDSVAPRRNQALPDGGQEEASVRRRRNRADPRMRR